ncbi:uncharacterized protein C8Q71DRAFT_910926 [Rhodofomes roseus]|uniref:C2H2-type domain-containing protein n=1 Tax=Rhodofomes roseus TaxID=34475 RepID=A0ABQ8K2A3_9APHY|nr:uncharacterized protein C8Q71DRAFT_910926 [Rhodofomes roseus]KAH9830885.1 hypothetical protein C8Q71DRAFT_910926 [Rhodofomes roseus]
MAAAAVAQPVAADRASPAAAPASPTAAPAAGVNKRYRPAPAKTFQCRGYGDCRMVFSRSEHLARHIRKHTGERPFTCHCGKQFSRLDNLRQHAQTVHADKQDQNERMMHDLTSLHASMTAATKGGARKRNHATSAAASAAAAASSTVPTMDIKREDGIHVLPAFHQRPGTSTGYEGAGALYSAAGTPWHVQTSDVDRPSMRQTTSHSFRDPGQSFRNPAAMPAASSNPSAHPAHPGQSFLVPSAAAFNFGVSEFVSGSPAGHGGPPRAPHDAAPASAATVLPPLAAVVSAALPSSIALPPPPTPTGAGYLPGPVSGSTGPLTESHVLPLPTPSVGLGRRPSTAARPGTAPAAYYYSASNAYGVPGAERMGARAELPPAVGLPSLSAVGRHGGVQSLRARDGYGWDGRDDGYYEREPTSPVGGYSDSPFSFHAPATAPLTPDYAAALPSAPYSNPRKRPFSGSDDDDAPPGSRSRGGPADAFYAGVEHEYGSESRPQSRRLSVMELCNEPDGDAGGPASARPILPLSAASGPGSAAARERTSPSAFSRPTTSGLVTSASQLALVDRDVTPESAAGSEFGGGYEYGTETLRGAGAAVFARAPPAAGGAAPEAAGAFALAAARGGPGARAREGGGPRESALFGGGGGVYAADRANVWHQRESAPAGHAPGAAGSGWSSVLHAGLPGNGPGSPVAGGWGRGGVPASPADVGRGLSPGGRAGSTGSVAGSPRSFGSGGGDGAESRGNDQVRIPATVGMRA